MKPSSKTPMDIGGFLRRWTEWRPRDAYNSPVADAIRLIALTGCRRGEAAGLRWENVDLKQGRILLPPQSHKTGRKTGKPREITLPAEAQKIIARPRGRSRRYGRTGNRYAWLEGTGMSAAFALKTAHAVGIRVRIDGDDLELEAAESPPSAVLDLLSLHKADILKLLSPADDGWSPVDWRVFFHERAAIAEFDGGLPRAEAEERAYACCVVEWLNQNPTTSTSGRCLACGAERDLAIRCCRSEPDTIGHAWVHREC